MIFFGLMDFTFFRGSIQISHNTYVMQQTIGDNMHFGIPILWFFFQLLQNYYEWMYDWFGAAHWCLLFPHFFDFPSYWRIWQCSIIQWLDLEQKEEEEITIKSELNDSISFACLQIVMHLPKRKSNKSNKSRCAMTKCDGMQLPFVIS